MLVIGEVGMGLRSTESKNGGPVLDPFVGIRECGEFFVGVM